jgi:hypothetical protein
VAAVDIAEDEDDAAGSRESPGFMAARALEQLKCVWSVEKPYASGTRAHDGEESQETVNFSVKHTCGLGGLAITKYVGHF